MLKTIKLSRFPETISYYTEDIEYSENGFYTCYGAGDSGIAEYELTFDEFMNLSMVEER